MRVIKKCAVFLLLLAVSAAIGSVSARAETSDAGRDSEIVYSGRDGDLDWNIDTDGLLTVNGTGDYQGYSVYDNDGNELIQIPEWNQYTLGINRAVVNVRRITNAAGMFYQCRELQSLDMSGFDTSQVTTMQLMFYDCSNLRTLDVSSFDTSKVTDMSYMFQGCSSLRTLDVSGFDTSKAASMYAMFAGCGNLQTLNVSGFDTSRTSSMIRMFEDCNNLQSLDVSSFDTSKATDMSYMFRGCNSLRTLDVSSFDTSRVTSMASMFEGCNNLQNLNVSGFDTSRAVNMSNMFYWCSSLQTLDISSFLISDSADSTDMFHGCSNIQTLSVPAYFKEPVPGTSWKNADGEICTEIPSNLSYPMTYERYDGKIVEKPAKTTAAVKLTFATSVKISWKKVNGASGYVVYRADSPNGNAERIKTIRKGSVLSCKDTGLKAGKTYYYYVAAYTAADKDMVYGDRSKAVSKKILGKLKAPVQKKIEIDKAKKTFTISWKPVKHAQKIEILRKVNGGEFKVWKTVPAEKGSAVFSYAGLAPGQYSFALCAYYSTDGVKVSSGLSNRYPFLYGR